jgi:hypothetical protein
MNQRRGIGGSINRCGKEKQNKKETTSWICLKP